MKALLNRIRQQWQHIPAWLLLRFLPKDWSEQLPGIKGKEYPDYRTYLFHQRLKRLNHAPLWMGHENQHKWLRERLIGLNIVKPGMSALCLGARTGGEVLAFLDLGCFAIGVDLRPVPGKQNFFVLYGDFHYLQFADNSVDIVYTNSLDHSLRLDKVLWEIKRVLKVGGLFILEAFVVTEGKWKPGLYESCIWDSFDSLIEIIVSDGLHLLRKNNINDYKSQAVFRK